MCQYEATVEYVTILQPTCVKLVFTKGERRHVVVVHVTKYAAAKKKGTKGCPNFVAKVIPAFKLLRTLIDPGGSGSIDEGDNNGGGKTRKRARVDVGAGAGAGAGAHRVGYSQNGGSKRTVAAANAPAAASGGRSRRGRSLAACVICHETRTSFQTPFVNGRCYTCRA